MSDLTVLQKCCLVQGSKQQPLYYKSDALPIEPGISCWQKDIKPWKNTGYMIKNKTEATVNNSYYTKTFEHDIR